MKTSPKILALLRFSFSSTRSRHLAWIPFVAYSLWCIVPSLHHLGHSGGGFDFFHHPGGSGLDFNFFWIFLCGQQIGQQFLGVWTKGTGYGLPHAEFILSRPVTRRQVQRYYTAFYLLLVLAPLLVSLGLSLLSPNLWLALHQGAAGPTEALDKLSYYQAQFPQWTILRDQSGNPNELLVPNGRLLAVAWIFVLATLAALQTIIICQSRPGWWKKLGAGMLGMEVATFGLFLVCTLFVDLRGADDILENTFFFFSLHWEWFALGTVALAVLVFRIVGKHADDIEV